MKYSITYKAVVGGDNPIDFAPTPVDLEDVAYPSAAISVQATIAPSCLSVVIECETTDSQDVVTRWARGEVDRILNRISFEYEVSIAEPGPPAVRRTPADRPSTCTFGGTIDCYLVKGRELATGEVRHSLHQTRAPDDAKCYWLRHALNNENIVARYMLLYRLLLDEKGGKDGSQRPVDEFIRQQFSKYKKCPVEERASTRPGARPNETEPVFTKLRSEIAHVAPTTATASTRRDITNTVTEITRFIPDLVWLVKQAMCE